MSGHCLTFGLVRQCDAADTLPTTPTVTREVAAQHTATATETVWCSYGQPGPCLTSPATHSLTLDSHSLTLDSHIVHSTAPLPLLLIL